MSKAQHTPGPWKTDGFKVVSRDGYQICRVDLNGGSNGFDSTNADLIASAPDLLKERDELKEQLKAAKVAFDKEVTQYDKEWSSHKATQSLNAELLEALKDSQAVIDFGTNCYRINSKLIAKAEGNG